MKSVTFVTLLELRQFLETLSDDELNSPLDQITTVYSDDITSGTCEISVDGTCVTFIGSTDDI